MNELIRLISNPITIIALVLAGFFILMAFLRNKGPRPQDGDGRANNETARRYHVTDPYAMPRTPEEPRPPPPGPSLATKTASPQHPETEQGRKYFRQFGSAPGGRAGPGGDPDGYIWE